jgi:hypothetical protein
MADERGSQNLPENPDPQEKLVSGDVLFQLLNNLRVDEQRRFWIAYPEADENDCDIREDLGQIGTEVKIVFPMSHNTLTRAEEYI